MKKNEVYYQSDDIKRLVIKDHYFSPHHKLKQTIKHALIKRKSNLSCMDDIVIAFKGEKGKVAQCFFDGVACSLSVSSTDILIDLILNKSFDDAKRILKSYVEMIKKGSTKEQNLLNEALVFINIKQHPNRMNCVLMGAELLLEIIREWEKNES